MSAMFQNWVLSSVWIPHPSKQLPLRRVMRKSVLCTPGQLLPTCFGSEDLRKSKSDVGFSPFLRRFAHLVNKISFKCTSLVLYYVTISPVHPELLLRNR